MSGNWPPRSEWEFAWQRGTMIAAAVARAACLALNGWIAMAMCCGAASAVAGEGPSALPQARGVTQAAALEENAGEEVPAAPRFKYQGARSCAAAACHGAAAPDTRENQIGRHEYLYWFEHDPHGRAQLGLTNARGKKILEQIGACDSRGVILNQQAYANCQACHNPQPPTTQQGPNFSANEGVGCEVCHGPSERWAAEHHRGQGSRAAAEAYGMRNTRSPAVRAAVCLPCHVGASDREVTHDLIAAGHPPLKFELTAFHEILPKHWNESRQRARTPSLELDLWWAGQLAAQTAAVELTAARAARAQGQSPANGTPWPEFAEFDCFACHHQLAGILSWRQQRGFTGKAGSLPYSNWYTASLFPADALPIAETEDRSSPRGESFARATHALGALRLAYAQSARPDPAQVGQRASQAAASLRALRTEWQEPSAPRTARLLAAWKQQAAQATHDWDTATQVYLLLAARQRFERDNGVAPLSSSGAQGANARSLQELRNLLAYPPQFESPRNFGVPQADTGIDTRMLVGQKLSELLVLPPGKPLSP